VRVRRELHIFILIGIMIKKISNKILPTFTKDKRTPVSKIIWRISPTKKEEPRFFGTKEHFNAFIVSDILQISK